MAQERELETRNRAGGLDSLVFSTRDDTVVFETNVEAFIWVQSLEPPRKTETDFVPFNCMHESGEPLSTSCYPCRLNEDLVTDQHARALLRETWNSKTNGPSISRFV